MLKYFIHSVFVLAVSALIISCGGNDDSEPAPEPDNTVHVPKYLNSILTPPNKVNVIFQLNDQNATPLSGLLAGDVSVQENGGILDAGTYNFQIAEDNDYDYTPYVVLAIDNNLDSEENLTNLKQSARSFISSLPTGTRVKVYSYSNLTVEVIDFSQDIPEVAAAIDAIVAGESGSNMYESIYDGITDIQDSISFGSARVAPGLVVAFAANDDTEGRRDVDDINTIIENVQVYSVSLGGAADSALVDITNYKGFVANTPEEMAGRTDELEALVDLYESSFYVFNYESDKTGSDDVEVIVSTARSQADDNMTFTYQPGLFFNPDSFEVKTDVLRFVLTGEARNGSVIVRKDTRNDSVDYQLFAGFEPSNYVILFTDKDPAIFNDWVNLNNDPDKIQVNVTTSEFTLDQGYQSPYIDPAIWDKKYMVIRDDQNRSDLSYIQMTLQ